MGNEAIFELAITNVISNKCELNNSCCVRRLENAILVLGILCVGSAFASFFVRLLSHRHIESRHRCIDTSYEQSVCMESTR